MSRVQLALRVGDLDGSIAFYSKLFNTEPHKLRPGYANFAVTEPALKLVLLQGEPGQDTVMDHLGVEVESTDQVNEATTRLTGEGLATLTEDATTCCYAVQDKVWVHGPGQEPWEVYTITDDTPTTYGADTSGTTTAADEAPAQCCDAQPATVGAGTSTAAAGCCTR